MATVQFIACRPLPVPVPTRHPSSQLAETETEMPFRSFQQPSSSKCHSFRRKQSCAASSRACAPAGTHGGGRPAPARRAAAGRRPSGRPPLAFGRGRGRAIDCYCTRQRRSEERSAFEVNTYVHVFVQAGRQAPGPNPVCVWIGRWSTLLIGGQTVPGGVGQRQPSVTRHHQFIE